MPRREHLCNFTWLQLRPCKQTFKRSCRHSVSLDPVQPQTNKPAGLPLNITRTTDDSNSNGFHPIWPFCSRYLYTPKPTEPRRALICYLLFTPYSVHTATTTTTMDIPTILTPPSPARSSSPDPARQLSRSPRPYRRRTLSSGTPPFSAASSSRKATYLPSPLPTPDTSRAPSPLSGRRRKRGRPSTGGSESGTEADDELTKRLPAPPGKRKRTLSEEDKYYGEEEEDVGDDGDGRGRRRKRRADEEDGDGKRRKRRGIVFVRRGIEVSLMGILVGVVIYNGGEGRVWREIVSWKIGKLLVL